MAAFMRQPRLATAVSAARWQHSKSIAPAPPLVSFLDLELDRVQAQLRSLGLPRYRTEQLWRAALRAEPPCESFSDLAQLSSRERKALAASFAPLRQSTVLKEESAADGVVKWLIGVPRGGGGSGSGGGGSVNGDVAGSEVSGNLEVEGKLSAGSPRSVQVEAVYIPEPRRGARGSGTLCVSSQAGCSLACTFCSTGQQEFSGGLGAGAIVEQFLQARARVAALGAPRLTHIVFMGQGEPLLNWRSVRTAIRAFTHEWGCALPPRRITVSTAGVAPLIAAVATDTPGVRLAVSLHAPSDALRSKIMGVNSRWPIAEVLRACQAYIDARLAARRGADGGSEGDEDSEDEGERLDSRPPAPGSRHVRVTFEYVLLEDVNDSAARADELAALLLAGIRDAGRHAHVNLLNFHEWSGAPYRRSSDAAAAAFRNALERRGIRATVRRTRGLDVQGACGQLRSSERLKEARVATAPSAN